MEANAVEASLQENRARIRGLLMLPDPGTGQLPEDQFPRSMVMRFMMDPRGRRMAAGALATLATLAGRRNPERDGFWPRLAQSLTLLGTQRRH